MTVAIAPFGSPAVAPPRREAVRLAVGTPGILRLMLGGTWVLSAVFLLAAAAGLGRYRQAVQTVGKDSAPSIVAAQRLRTSFARCHADAAAVVAGQPGAVLAYASSSSVSLTASDRLPRLSSASLVTVWR